MKQLIDILEKLIINKNTEHHYNPDDLNNDDIDIFDTTEWDGDDEIGADKYQQALDDIYDVWEKLKAKGAFAVYRYNLSHMKEKNLKIDSTTRCEYDSDVADLIDELITWKDYEYVIRLRHGHIELDCINSGSRTTWYIYALTEDAFTHVEDYFAGEDYIKDLDFLYKEGTIIEIEKRMISRYHSFF